MDDDLKKLHTNVERLKSNKQIGVKYMHMQEVIKYAIKEGVEEAKEQLKDQWRKELEEEARQKMETEKKELEEAARQKMEAARKEMEAAAKLATEKAQQRVLTLTQKLLELERFDDLRRIIQDNIYLEKLLEEYDIY